MKKHIKFLSMLPVYILILGGFLAAALHFSKTVTVNVENAPVVRAHCVIIDAGHGGVDGGATSCTGVLESNMNLQFALKLNDLLRLLGINTKMIRTTDISVYTKGESIAAKKVSDLKQRVKIVNETENSLLISLHMNHFTDSRYHGPQVFYAPVDQSRQLAEQMQENLNRYIDPDGKRNVKKADGIYLMQNIQSPGILIECGFISNPEEEARLRDDSYQRRVCAVIAATTSSFLSEHLTA